MELRHMQYIVSIAEYLSITKAAEMLYVSQPSLSHYVAKAEKELGVKLFDRSTSPISLTYAGERFVKTAQQMLALKQIIDKEFADLSDNRHGRIRIGMPHERAAFMLPEILPTFSAEYPQMELQIMTANSASLLDALDKGRIDFFIAPFADEHHTYETIPIAREELIFVAKRDSMPRDVLLNGQTGHIDIAKTDGLTYVLLKEGHSVRKLVDRLFQEARISPHVLMEATENLTALRLAAAGVGVAIMPQMTAYIANGADCIDCFRIGDPPVAWTVSAVFRKGVYIGKAEKRFVQLGMDVYAYTVG